MELPDRHNKGRNNRIAALFVYFMEIFLLTFIMGNVGLVCCVCREVISYIAPRRTKIYPDLPGFTWDLQQNMCTRFTTVSDPSYRSVSPASNSANSARGFCSSLSSRHRCYRTRIERMHLIGRGSLMRSMEIALFIQNTTTITQPRLLVSGCFGPFLRVGGLRIICLLNGEEWSGRGVLPLRSEAGKFDCNPFYYVLLCLESDSQLYCSRYTTDNQHNTTQTQPPTTCFCFCFCLEMEDIAIAQFSITQNAMRFAFPW